MGSHMRSMLPRLPPLPMNHCVNVMSSNARTISARAGNVHAQRTHIKKCADPGTEVSGTFTHSALSSKMRGAGNVPMPPSKSTKARTMGEVPRASALASLSPMFNCEVRAKAYSTKAHDTHSNHAGRRSTSLERSH